MKCVVPDRYLQVPCSRSSEGCARCARLAMRSRLRGVEAADAQFCVLRTSLLPWGTLGGWGGGLSAASACAELGAARAAGQWLARHASPILLDASGVALAFLPLGDPHNIPHQMSLRGFRRANASRGAVATADLSESGVGKAPPTYETRDA